MIYNLLILDNEQTANSLITEKDATSATIYHQWVVANTTTNQNRHFFTRSITHCVILAKSLDDLAQQIKRAESFAPNVPIMVISTHPPIVEWTNTSTIKCFTTLAEARRQLLKM